MEAIADTIGHERVAAVIDRFYAQVRQHPTLAEPFTVVHDWPSHLARLTHFWWVTLGGARYLDYRYHVPQRHAEAGFTPALLVDWLALFRQTLTNALPSELANAWYERAERIGESLRLMHDLGHFAHPNARGPIDAVAVPH